MDDIQLARFMAKVVKQQDGCWLWQGAAGGRGVHRYGLFWVRPTLRIAHRVSYEQWVGPLIVDDRKVSIDHLCGVKLCVNPKHLEQVSHRENLHRSSLTVNAINAAKTHCVNGHKFTPKNTYISPTNGQRVCRTCKRNWARKARREERA